MEKEVSIQGAKGHIYSENDWKEMSEEDARGLYSGTIKSVSINNT